MTQEIDEFEEEAARLLGPREQEDRGKKQSSGGGASRAPRMITGDDPVNDFERNMFRSLVPNLDQISRMIANRQLGDNNVDFHITNFGWRRWIEIAQPPRVLRGLSWERKFSSVGTKPTAELTQAEIEAAAAGEIGLKVTAALYVPGQPPTQGLTVLGRPYRWYVLDADRAERPTRMFDGFFGIPHDDVVKKYEELAGPDLWTKAMDPSVPDNLVQDEKDQLFDLYWKAQGEVWESYMNFRTVVDTFRGQYLTQYPHNRLSDRGKFYRPVVYTHRFQYWVKQEKTMRDKVSEAQPQDVFESNLAYDAAADMMSAVVKPLPVDEMGVIHRGMEEVWYNSAYDGHHLRKAMDAIKQKQMLDRAVGNLIMSSSTVKDSPDKWLPGSWESIRVGDMVLPDTPRRLAEVYLGDIGKLPDDAVIQPGPFLAAEYLKYVFRFKESIEHLTGFFDFLRGLQITEGGQIRNHNGEILTQDDFIGKWAAGKSLIQEKPEDLVWTYRRPRPDGPIRWYWDPAPGRKPSAVPRNLKLLWMDFPFAMGEFDLVHGRVAQYLNDKAVEAGLSVRIGFDGPDSNYFRHQDILWEAYQERLAPWILMRLQEIWKREVGKKTPHIRPVYYKELLSEIPEEFLRNVGLPAKQVPESDWIARIVQHFNKMSDRRVRIWAAFKSHGRKGGIRGFQISDAVHFVEAGYGTDNGLSKDHQQGRQADLIMLAWLGGQFDKAVYLTRELKYYLVNSNEQIEQIKMVSRAIGSGLHPRIALVIVKKLNVGKIFDWSNLMMKDTPTEVSYIEDVFNDIEAEKLGDAAIKAVTEGRMHEELERVA